jgi:hypothetical protein
MVVVNDLIKGSDAHGPAAVVIDLGSVLLSLILLGTEALLHGDELLLLKKVVLDPLELEESEERLGECHDVREENDDLGGLPVVLLVTDTRGTASDSNFLSFLSILSPGLRSLVPPCLPRALLVLLNLDAKLWVPSNDARNYKMVILTITRVRKRTEVPLYHFPKGLFQRVSNPRKDGWINKFNTITNEYKSQTETNQTLKYRAKVR